VSLASGEASSLVSQQRPAQGLGVGGWSWVAGTGYGDRRDLWSHGKEIVIWLSFLWAVLYLTRHPGENEQIFPCWFFPCDMINIGYNYCDWL
jgi:hypothetical protein